MLLNHILSSKGILQDKETEAQRVSILVQVHMGPRFLGSQSSAPGTRTHCYFPSGYSLLLSNACLTE